MTTFEDETVLPLWDPRLSYAKPLSLPTRPFQRLPPVGSYDSDRYKDEFNMLWGSFDVFEFVCSMGDGQPRPIPPATDTSNPLNTCAIVPQLEERNTMQSNTLNASARSLVERWVIHACPEKDLTLLVAWRFLPCDYLYKDVSRDYDGPRTLRRGALSSSGERESEVSSAFRGFETRYLGNGNGRTFHGAYCTFSFTVFPGYSSATGTTGPTRNVQYPCPEAEASPSGGADHAPLRPVLSGT